MAISIFFSMSQISWFRLSDTSLHTLAYLLLGAYCRNSSNLPIMLDHLLPFVMAKITPIKPVAVIHNRNLIQKAEQAIIMVCLPPANIWCQCMAKIRPKFSKSPTKSVKLVWRATGHVPMVMMFVCDDAMIAYKQGLTMAVAAPPEKLKRNLSTSD